MGYGQWWRSLLLLLLLCAGCADVRFHMGMPFDSGDVQKLELGKSTEDEVRDLLGEPSGTGKENLPISRGQRTVWYYYYEEGSTKESRRRFLFIYFEKERYDGFMWFASLP